MLECDRDSYNFCVRQKKKKHTHTHTRATTLGVCTYVHVYAILQYTLFDNCVPTGKLAKGTTTDESNATPCNIISLYYSAVKKKKEVGWAVSGTTDFVI